MSDEACSVGCGHPPDDHEDGKCMHLCDCAWPTAENDVPVWCHEHMEPYCPRHAGQSAEKDGPCSCANGPGPRHMWGPMECPPRDAGDDAPAIVRITTIEGQRHSVGTDPHQRRRLLTRRFLRRLARVLPPGEGDA